MSYLDYKDPPKREDRLNACIAWGGTMCGLAKKTKKCCLADGDREFSQGSICLLLPALGMMNSLPDTVVLLHGASGCGSSIHSGTAAIRAGVAIRTGQPKDTLWLSTSLDEADVIGGGEKKLERAIREADIRYRPKVILVIATCVPGIIGDDINGVAERLQPEVSARIVPVHCEGFKTKIWATAYDSVYHGIGRNLLEEDERRLIPLLRTEEEELAEKRKLARTVNVMNAGSIGRIDELEQERLLKSLGLEVNFYPLYTKPEDFVNVTRAALSVSTCPTHDDYFLSFLAERYGVPYIIKHMPIGIENTSRWILDIAEFFNLEKQARKLIETEEKELNEALAPFREAFKGKKAFVSAGEIRALATAGLLHELGFDISAIRPYHHDEFAEVEYEKLDKIARESGKDFTVDIANVQPFEEANLLQKTKPDIFLGHLGANSTAAKLGIATHAVYNSGFAYVGYRGAFELARRLFRQLKNPSYNRNLAGHTSLPYQKRWYHANPFRYIQERPADG